MAKINDETITWFGSQWNADQMVFGIPAGPDGEDPGILFLEATNSSGTPQTGLYLWADSGAKLRYSATKPTDEDASGDALDNTTIGAAANKALSNLASVAIATDLDPASSNAYDLGDSTHVYAESFVTKSVFYPTNSYITGTSAVATLTGALVCGADGTGSDVTLTAATSGSFAKWTKTTTGVFNLTDDAIISFGDGDDFTMKFNAASMLLDNKTANTGNLLIGSAVNTDIAIESQSSAGKDITWDASAYTWTFLDTTKLAFGTSDDIVLAYASGNTLSWTQGSSGVGSILKGVDDKGIDETWYAETGSDYMKWDQDGASNLGALIFEDSVIQISGANVAYTLGISTDALVITGTDHANNNVVFGTHSTTNATDVTFSCASSGDHVKFVGTGTWTYTDVPVTMTGANQSGTLLTVAGIDTTGNTDTVVITHKGTASALKISNATTVNPTALLELVPMAAQTTTALWVDGATNNWDGADNVGMVHINTDDPMIHAGASLLYVSNTGTPINSATGFVATFSDTGTNVVTDPAYAVAIESTNNFGLHIVTGSAACTALTIDGVANSTVAYVNVNGDATGFLGAANVGMVTLTNDIALTDVLSSTLLIDVGTTKPIDAAEGYCLRIIDTSLVATSNNSYATYIDATANHGMAIETRAAAAVNLTLLGVAAQTASMLKLDGQTGAGWEGAANVGQLHIVNDSAFDDQGSALYIDLAEAPTAASEGAGIHVIQSAGSATTDGYLVNIEAVATGGGLHVDGGYSTFDEKATFVAGSQNLAVALTATDAGVAIPSGTSVCLIDVDGDANHRVLLPAPIQGNMITFHTTSTDNFELSTNANTNFINGVECTGAAGSTKEMVVVDDAITVAICTVSGSAGKWVTYSIAVNGVVTDGQTTVD